MQALCENSMHLNCKCGNIDIEWDTKVSPLVARKCGCEYCTQQNGEFVSDADSTVSYKIRDSSLHKIVRNGSGTADFHECKSCGVVLVTSEIENVLYSVINAKALSLKDYTLDPKVKNYNGESVDERLSRRKKNWCRAKACI